MDSYKEKYKENPSKEYERFEVYMAVTMKDGVF
jgi:hypothetical protein